MESPSIFRTLGDVLTGQGNALVWVLFILSAKELVQTWIRYRTDWNVLGWGPVTKPHILQSLEAYSGR